MNPTHAPQLCRLLVSAVSRIAYGLLRNEMGHRKFEERKHTSIASWAIRIGEGGSFCSPAPRSTSLLNK